MEAGRVNFQPLFAVFFFQDSFLGVNCCVFHGYLCCIAQFSNTEQIFKSSSSNLLVVYGAQEIQGVGS